MIIGKNNIGKSSLIDMIEFHYNPNVFCDECKKNSNLKLIIEKEISEDDLSGFSKSTHSSWNNDRELNDHDYAMQNYIGKHFIYNYRVIPKKTFSDKPITQETKNYIANEDFNNLDTSLTNQILNGIKVNPKTTKRIYAERNILPEKDSNIIQVDGNGNGACNIINKFINKNS